jgi:hypothetical protein
MSIIFLQIKGGSSVTSLDTTIMNVLTPILKEDDIVTSLEAGRSPMKRPRFELSVCCYVLLQSSFLMTV